MQRSCTIYWDPACMCAVHENTATAAQHVIQRCTHVNESCHTYRWVMSHIWMSHVARMNESCHVYMWVLSHIWMNHVTYVNESCCTYGWGMSRIWMRHVARMDESCHVYEWVMTQVLMSYVTYVNETCHTYAWVMSRIWMSHVARMDESSVCHDSFIYVTYDCMCRDSFILQTEETALEIITTAKISNKFSRESLYIWNNCSRESPKFQTSFLGNSRCPRQTKDLSGKLIDLEIQIF